jgi:hypothetical protein
MAESVFELLKKKGIVVPEHHIQPLMSQLDAYQILNNNPNLEKLAGKKEGHKHLLEEFRH